MYKDVLLAVDLGQESSWTKSLPLAIDTVGNTGATLHTMTVIPNFGMSIVDQFFPKGFEKEVGQKIMEQLKVWVKENVPGDIKVRHIVGDGTVYEEILDIAKKINADLIIISSHRPELKDYLLGPNAARVVRHAGCSVLVVR